MGIGWLYWAVALRVSLSFLMKTPLKNCEAGPEMVTVSWLGLPAGITTVTVTPPTPFWKPFFLVMAFTVVVCVALLPFQTTPASRGGVSRPLHLGGLGVPRADIHGHGREADERDQEEAGHRQDVALFPTHTDDARGRCTEGDDPTDPIQ